MNKNLILVGVVVIGILGIIFVAGGNKNQAVVELGDSAESKQIAGTSDSSEKSETEGESSSESGLEERYVAYSEANLAKVDEEDGKAVVFFHATWCPMCKAAEKDFQANFSEVPGDVHVLKTDYDTSGELKTKYGIVMQDTFVQVDPATGEEITKWQSGGEGIAMLLKNIQ